MPWLSTPNRLRPSSGTGAGTLSWDDVSFSMLTMPTPLLPRFYGQVRSCYTALRTSIATLRHRITVWSRCGPSFLHSYNILMEMYNTKKEKLWVQSLRALRHQSIQAIAKYAAQLLQEQWSIMEDISERGHHCVSPQKDAPNRVAPSPLHPNASVHPVLFPLPLSQKWDSRVPSPAVISAQLCLHVVSLPLSDILAVFNATR